MSVAASTSFDPYVGDGSTNHYTGNFRITDATQAQILLDGVVQPLGSYTISGVGNATFEVTFPAVITSGVEVSILRNQPISQLSAYQGNEAYNPVKILGDLDKAIMVAQMLREQIGRAPKFARGSTNSEFVFPEPGGDDAVIGWTGGILRNKTLVTSDGLVIAARSVKDFGAVGDGTTDDTQAFSDAFDSELTVFVPAGDYLLTSGLLTPSVENFALYGDGWGSRLIMHHASAPLLTIAGGQNGHRVQGLYLDRDIAATTGGNGINATTTLNYALLQDLRIANQYNGVVLGPTGFSSLRHSICEYNYNNGVLILNTASDGACQWSMSDVACFQNDAHGFFISSIAGPAQMTLGTYERLTTYGNTGSGIRVNAIVGVPIQAIRLDGGFIGGDGDHEIVIDTYGDQHRFWNVFTEGAGTFATGRTLQTAASNTGSGIAISANNAGVSLNGCHASANSDNGFASEGPDVQIVGCKARDNGQAGTSGRKNGVYIIAGSASISGLRSGNFGGATQDDGVRSDVDGIVIGGASDLRGNNTNGFNQTVPIVTTVVGSIL